MSRNSSSEQPDPEPSDEEIVDLLVGTEEKSDPAVNQMVNRLQSSTEFSHRDNDGVEL